MARPSPGLFHLTPPPPLTYGVWRVDLFELNTNLTPLNVRVAIPDTDINSRFVPLTSFSFLNQRRSAAGLLPWVMQVRVMWSPSMAGFVRPSISGFSGTPEGLNGNQSKQLIHTGMWWGDNNIMTARSPATPHKSHSDAFLQIDFMFWTNSLSLSKKKSGLVC